MKKEKLNILEIIIVTINVFAIMGLLRAIILFISKNSKISLALTLLIGTFLMILFYFSKDEISLMIKKEKENKKLLEKKKECENNKNQRELSEKLEELKFINAPIILSSVQEEELEEARKNIIKYLMSKYLIKNISFNEVKKNKLYCLLIIENLEVSVDVSTYNSAETIFLKYNKNNIEIVDDSFLNNYLKKKENVSKISKPKKTSTKVKNLRKLRKKKESSVEISKEIVIKNGKEFFAPNYDFIAREWNDKNMGLLNKLVQDEMSRNNAEKIEVLIPEINLPQKEAWRKIGEQLRKDNEIDSFKLSSNGIIITVS